MVLNSYLKLKDDHLIFFLMKLVLVVNNLYTYTATVESAYYNDVNNVFWIFLVGFILFAVCYCHPDISI